MGDKMEENINALDEINKGACMGMDAIDDILDKVEDSKFKSLLEKQYGFYESIKDDITNIYDKYNSDDTPHETSVMNKVMTWSGINMKTMTNHSNSNIAELLLQGTNMGIIEGRRILNKKEINKDVEDIIDKFVKKQEKYVEDLKKFL